MGYPCAKFGDFSFSHFGFMMQTDRIRESGDHDTYATTIGMGNLKKVERFV